jgi:hypothetical protein
MNFELGNGTTVIVLIPIRPRKQSKKKIAVKEIMNNE